MRETRKKKKKPEHILDIKNEMTKEEINAMLNARELTKAIEMLSIMDVLGVDANTLLSRERRRER